MVTKTRKTGKVKEEQFAGASRFIVVSTNTKNSDTFNRSQLTPLMIVPLFCLRKESWEMDAKTMATIVVDVSAGFIVVLVGLGMLPFPLNIMWGLFNVWLWIASPAILWANKKENDKKLLNSL
jgi:hypothetical protein